MPHELRHTKFVVVSPVAVRVRDSVGLGIVLIFAEKQKTKKTNPLNLMLQDVKI